MGSSNRNGVDLGRINTCKIVGGKARHIEVRCREEVCTQNCWECIDGSCVAQVGGQFDTEADCLANPFANSCITEGDLYTGFGNFTVSFDDLSTNSPNTVYIDSYWECSNCICTQPTCCDGPNGGIFTQLHQIKVYDAANNLVFTNLNGVTELVNWLQVNGVPAAAVGMTFVQLLQMWDVATSPGHGLPGGTIIPYDVPCTCTGCGSGPGASWECYEGAAGSYCADPLDGSGQYPTEAACLAAIAAGGNDDCDTNGNASGAGTTPTPITRVNGAAGTIFPTGMDAFFYYGDPANGISGTNAASLYFEVVESSYCQTLAGSPANQSCCPGPNSTAANPTNKVYITHLGYTNMYDNGQLTNNIEGCCNFSIDNLDPSIFPGWFSGSVASTSFFGLDYGNMPNNFVAWDYDDLLTQAVAAGITGVTMNTPVAIGGSMTAPGTLHELMETWLQGGGYPSHPCHGQNYCIDSGATDTGVGLNGCEAAYDWFAANQPAADFFLYYWDDLSGAGGSCPSPTGNAYYRVQTTMIFDQNNNLVGSPPNNTNAVAAFINTYPGSGITTATGAMTFAQINNLLLTSGGTLKGGSMTVACIPCTCTGNTQIRCTIDGPLSTWYYSVCQLNICTNYNYCLCEPGCDNITYDCDPITCQCYDPGNGTGAYSGPTALADCQAACCPIQNEDSWDCIDGVCIDPGDGTGQFATEALCLASPGVNSCDTNGDHSNGNNSPRVHMAPGTIFSGHTEAQEWYCDPANGVSGTNYDTFMFEMTGCPPATSYGDTCEGPNSTIAIPTCMGYLSGVPGWRLIWNNGQCCTDPSTVQGCCNTNASIYGPEPVGNTLTFSGNTDPNLLAFTNGCFPNDGINPVLCPQGAAYLPPGMSNMGYTNFLAMVNDLAAVVPTVNPATTIWKLADPLDIRTLAAAYWQANPVAGQLSECSVSVSTCSSVRYCRCTDCGSGPGSEDMYECLPEQGCVPHVGGTYSSLALCQQNTTNVNPCANLLDWTGIKNTYGTMNNLKAAITDQANGQTNVDVTTLCGYLHNVSSGAVENCSVPWPAPTPPPCPELYSAAGIQVGFTAFVPSELGTGAQLAGLQVSYTKWDDLLADCIAIPITGVNANTTYFTLEQKMSVHYSYKSQLKFDYTCCECADSCSPPEPAGRKDCLVLLLDATDTSSVTLQTPPLGPMIPNFVYPIEQVMNLAYNPSGLGINPMAFYTWDKIDNDVTTAPGLRMGGGMFPWNAFQFTTNAASPNGQFLIANPAAGAPTQAVLQPDTSSEAGYGNGWTIIFHRMTSSTEWVNSKTWFMGDDVSDSAPEKMQRVSGLKPHDQPYCRSNYYGHHHWDGNTAHDYEASPLNEMFNTGYRTLKSGMWYAHWIIATEQLPVGSGIFTVIWGVGNVVQFKDTMVNVNMDMVLKNINTRNRGKDGFVPGQGWISEIRAYNCAFNKYQIKDELDNLELKYGYGTLNIPDQLPPGCGDAFKSTAFDGVDGTYLEVQGGDQILPSDSGFSAAFWIKMNDCVDEDACLFEKGINLPADNEQVAFRLYLTDDAAYLGKLYWDVFGDNPLDYVNNYQRAISNVAWLGEADCATLVGKWKHVAVTMSNASGANKKIYINGEDVTTYSPGQASGISGNVRRDTNFPLNIGDSSRVDYTTKGNYTQFITWDTELSAEEIKEVYGNGEYFDPLYETVPELGAPYQRGENVTFYTDFDTEEIKDLSKNMIPTVKHGGITLDEVDSDPVEAGLPTDIPGLEIWLRAGTSILANQDASNNTISRADYMISNPLQVGDKIAIWQCHANLGRYAAQITQTYKPKYESDGTSNKLAKGIYTDATDRLQIYHTHADGGINIDAADEVKGAFSMQFRIAIEAETISAESIMGDTADNFIRLNTSTQLRVKLGGGANKNFTIPAAVASGEVYTFTLTRAADGTLHAYIDGGVTSVFDDVMLTGSGTHVETNAATIDHILGIPGVGMQGWFFDFIYWKDIVLSNDIRKQMYKVINETVRTL